jgi:group I intron endonuclease
MGGGSRMIELKSSGIKYCIYAIICTLTDKAYIGATNNYDRRSFEHFDQDTWRKNRTNSLYIDMQNHGVDNFIIFPVKELEYEHELRDAEILTISQFRTNGIDLYNIAKGGYKKPKVKPSEDFAVSVQYVSPKFANKSDTKIRLLKRDSRRLLAGIKSLSEALLITLQNAPTPEERIKIQSKVSDLMTMHEMIKMQWDKTLKNLLRNTEDLRR